MPCTNSQNKREKISPHQVDSVWLIFDKLFILAQHALRLIAFGQMHKVLGMPTLPDAIKEAKILAEKASK